jgi:cyanophycin synthetase
MPPSTVSSIPGVRVPSAPSVTLQSHVRLPITADLALLDEWLTAGLEVPIEPLAEVPQGVDPHAAAVLWRGLLLAREFLQLAKIPAFDPPQILGLEPQPSVDGVWKVTVSLPRVDQILNNAYALAFNAGVDVCLQVCRLPRTSESAAQVYTAIVQKVIDPLRRMVVAGESGMHVLREARRLDIPFFHLGSDVFQLGWGRRRRLIDRSSLVGDSALGSRLVRNKYLAASFVRQAGLPAPEHELVGRIEEARPAAARIRYPVVVKPTDRERGEGVTTGVQSDAALAAALTVALQATPSRQALVEREVPGVCHRLFMVRGRLLYAVKRLPHSIAGDGRRTIAQLVVAANAREAARPPWRREKHYPLDTLALQVLAARGLGPSSVPAAGAFVPLRPIETTAWGGHDEEVTATIHPENVRVARRAAEIFALDVAGVDIISPDITRPWHENGAIINEVNFAPLLGGHDISRSHIARYLRDLVEEDGRIPVEVFVGGAEAFAAARSRHAELVSRGTAAFLTSHDTTFDATGRSLPLAVHGLGRRCRALFLDQAVGAIVLVVQTDELERSGLPFDRITALHVVDRQLVRHDQPEAVAADGDTAGVIERLRACLVDADASGYPAKR